VWLEVGNQLNSAGASPDYCDTLIFQVDTCRILGSMSHNPFVLFDAFNFRPLPVTRGPKLESFWNLNWRNFSLQYAPSINEDIALVPEGTVVHQICDIYIPFPFVVVPFSLVDAVSELEILPQLIFMGDVNKILQDLWSLFQFINLC